jgi:hypothetical protein
VDLYKAATGNHAYALLKKLIDQILVASTANVSNSLFVIPAFFNLDALEDLRNQANAQKISQENRFAIISSPLASALGQDDRIRSNLFYGQRNGEQGYRVWKNIGGFNTVREYPDFPGGPYGGLIGDDRLVGVSVRKITDMQAVAKNHGIKPTMAFWPVTDESGLEMMGVGFQEQGTVDVYVALAMLLGIGVGNRGGAAGTVTDNAGCLIRVA